MLHYRHEPQRILITGYGGFVASHLVEACTHRYPAAQLFGLTHAASQPPRPILHADGDRSGDTGSQARLATVTEVAGDITDGARLRQVLHETQPDLIFHLAATSSVAASWQDPAETLRVNAGGFIRLAEAVRAEGLTPRIVVSGSGEQYGLVDPEENPVNEETLPRPANPYAVSKVAQDLSAFQFFRAYGLDVVRARAFNHFGPGQTPTFVLASFARQIAQIEAGQVTPAIQVGNLSAQRDFLPVDAVVRAYLALAEYGRAGEAYNVGSGVARSIESVLKQMLAMVQVPIEVSVDPTRFRPSDVPVLFADIKKIQCDTGWYPDASLDDGLRMTIDYWRGVTLSDSALR